MEESGNEVLKGVSRSFYLTLRLLPRPMRCAASLGYLLARTSDTLADSTGIPHELRLRHLEEFRTAIATGRMAHALPSPLIDALPDPRERRLLAVSSDLVRHLGRIAPAEAGLVRDVLETIISGQALDLIRFAGASRGSPVALPDEESLEDYTWRVAGCVGAFWTRLGFLTLGEKFSSASEADLLPLGITYGKGLQLVNILRDVRADLAAGRCYLPVVDPCDEAELMDCHARWLARAGSWVGDGVRYSNTLVIRRLRAASILPALLAEKTLDPLRNAGWTDLQERIKIPRSTVYLCLARAFFRVP